MSITSIRVPDTISKLSDQDTYPVVQGADVGGFTDLQNEVNSNTSKIETNITNINNLVPVGKTMVLKVVGDTPPDFGNEPHGNYFVTARTMTKTLELTTPNPTGGPIDGAILTVFNEDPTDAIRVSPGKVGDTVSGGAAVNIPPDNFASFVYTLKDTNWMTLESGYIPAARINISNFIEQKLDADGKLHTEAELESSGFLKGVKVTGDDTSTVQDAKWLHFDGAKITTGKTDQAVVTIKATGDVDPTKVAMHFQTIAERDQWSAAEGSKYVDVLCIVDKDANGFAAWYLWDGSKWNTHDADGVIMADSDGAIPRPIRTVVYGPGFKIQQAGDQEDAALVTYGGGAGSGDGSITLDDGTSNVAGISSLDLKGMMLTKLPTSPGGSAGVAEVTAGMDVTNYGVGGGSGLTTKISTMPPLNVYSDPDTVTNNDLRLEIKPGAFESMASPSFLAYLQETEEVTGKLDIHGQPTGHSQGAVWFDDIVVPSGPYIVTDRTNKAYGLQEADELDPNVTGGMNYLVCFRMAFKGKAPNDGFVRIFLKEKQVGTQGSFDYLEDANGHPMAVERYYKAGEELGHLDVIGVVNAKGIKEFQCMAEDSFEDDMLNIEDRENGASGLMIQALKSDDKTGRALLQYMHDTGQDIMFNSHWLGVERMSIKWMTGFTQPIVDLTAGSGSTMADGMSFYPVNDMKVGIQNGHMMFQDNGTDIPDFHFGKVFRADETQMLRGRVVTVKATITDKNAGWNIGLFKWAGKPDEFTDHIFSSRLNTAIQLDTDWSLEDSLFISEDAISGDHTVTKDFTVPADANNYAVAIYPVEASSPMNLKLKEFELDVKDPFLGFDIHAPVLDSEKHLVFSDEHKQFTQDRQGYAGLRYTIDNDDINGHPMPIGEDKGGNADIELDTTASVAMISGSSARGGEGCLKFNADGNVRIVSNVYLWNEQGTDSTVKFWWAKVSPDGNTVTKLPDSMFTATVKAGAKGTRYAFGYDHDFEDGDRICLRASSDKSDGAFIEATTSVPYSVSNYLEFKELKVGEGGDDPWGSLDLSQFEHVYSHELDGRIVIQNASSATVKFEIEPHMFFDVKRAIKIEGGIARPVRSLDYSYNYATHELKISLGEVVQEARVLVGVYV